MSFSWPRRCVLVSLVPHLNNNVNTLLYYSAFTHQTFNIYIYLFAHCHFWFHSVIIFFLFFFFPTFIVFVSVFTAVTTKRLVPFVCQHVTTTLKQSLSKLCWQYHWTGQRKALIHSHFKITQPNQRKFVKTTFLWIHFLNIQ